ncbi:MAG: hypothetical protein PVJ76_13045 [Gemmatimonadota bacterium]|jgi:hypothetical protein
MLLLMLVTLAGFPLSACYDLEVTNPNEPDSERALSKLGDVQALVSASYYSWFQASYFPPNYSYGPAGMILNNQSFQATSPWANFGMEFYGRIPRVGIVNEHSETWYRNISYSWERCYRALSALASGLKAMEDPELSSEMGAAGKAQYLAYGRFVQGLAHGTVALLYARGFILDETTDLEDDQTFVDYSTLMDQAFVYFDDAIGIATSSSFVIPYDWIQADLDSPGLVRLIHSYKARFRALLPRTPEERSMVDWNRVISDVDAGIQETYNTEFDWNVGFWNGFLDFSTYSGWHQLPYFMLGMADQSGAVAEWFSLPLLEKRHRLPDDRPVLIVTPDLRFPQGSSVEEQRVEEGMYFRILEAWEEGLPWRMPERGTWRWSWYQAGHGRGLDYYEFEQFGQPEITLAEMRLLKAEGLFRSGDRAGAAAIINKTRLRAGLSPTDASGTNASCVPKLPNGACGDLWEMLKWEKRMETVWTGPFGNGWFFDGRGWGDLWKDTPLQWPVPCQEVELTGNLPCATFGGPGGLMSAPVSTYDFPFER